MRLIDADKLKEEFFKYKPYAVDFLSLINNAPTVELRLMKCEECEGHTIEYAMGWKACIEWLKSGGDTKWYSHEDMSNVKDLTKEEVEGVEKQAKQMIGEDKC